MKRLLLTVVTIVLVVWSVWGARYYHLGDTVLSDTKITLALPADAATLTFEARGVVAGDREGPGESRSAWGVEYADGLRIELRAGNTAFGDAADMRYMRVKVTKDSAVFADCRFDRGFIALEGDANSLIVTRRKDGKVTVSGGSGVPVEVVRLSLEECDMPESVRLFAEGTVRFEGAVSEWDPDPVPALVTEWTRRKLDERFASSTDPMEGYWVYFDRDVNPVYARLGGRYTLASVADGKGGYTLLYMDGAEVCGDRWHEGMVKARLHPTVFVGQFDLEWIDAEMKAVTRDISARFENAALMVAEFPLLRASLRFSRVPVSRQGR